MLMAHILKSRVSLELNKKPFSSLPLFSSSSLPVSKNTTKWVRSISSISCATHIPIASDSDQNLLNSNEFEAKIQLLRNKPVSDNLIRILDATSDLNSAVKIFKWASLQRRFRHTADTYYRIILKLGMAGNVHDMEGFCAEMVKEKCPHVEEAFVALIDTFIKHHKLNEAIRIVAAMILGGYKPSIDVFNVLLGALVEEKKEFKDVLFVYKEIVKAEILPNVDTLNHLLEALLDANCVDSALDQFRRMKKKGCNPNSRTFEVLVGGLITKDRVEESVTVLGEMFDAGCEVNMSFYTTMIPLFCRTNKPEEGLRLFKKMKESKLVSDKFLFEALIKCLCEKLWLDDAVIIVKDMIEINLTPTDDVFVNITNVFCKLGKFDEAGIFLEDNQVLEASPYNALLEGYCSAGEFRQAKGLFEKMSERNVADDLSCNILIRWLCQNARIGQSFELLGRMIVSSFTPDCDTYSSLVVGKCKLSKYEDALQLFHQICSKYWVLDSISYAELVEGLCQVVKIQEAIEVFYYMSSNRCALQSSTLNMLISAVCESGKVDEAIRLRSLAYCSGTSCTTATYTAIMLRLFKLNKAKDLLAVLCQMLVEGCTLDAEAYAILIKGTSTLNRAKDCALFFVSMVNEGLLPDSETLANLLSCLAEHSQLHTVLATVDKITSKWDILTPPMYNMLIIGLCKEGYKNKACCLLDLMLEKGWIPDATTHGLLIGSVVREEPDGETLVCEDFAVQDTVDNILVDSLGKI